MSVYVDNLMNTTGQWQYKRACHLKADTLEELHAFAQALGLKREWFQCDHINVAMHHYDLTQSKRVLAIRKGAIPLNRVEWAAKTKELTRKYHPIAIEREITR